MWYNASVHIIYITVSKYMYYVLVSESPLLTSNLDYHNVIVPIK
jgi:hypothetical protein